PTPVPASRRRWRQSCRGPPRGPASAAPPDAVHRSRASASASGPPAFQLVQLLTQPTVDGGRPILDAAGTFQGTEPLPQLAVDAQRNRDPVAEARSLPP